MASKSQSYPLVIILFMGLGLGIFLLNSCGPDKEKIEKIKEDGIEVVINHLEPYKTGEKSSFTFEKRWSIDTENPEIQKLGLMDIRGFEVNSAGEIFVLGELSSEGNLIFKFDKDRQFIKSFGHQGQGPGEVEAPFHISLDGQENIMVSDSSRQLVVIYDSDGSFVKNQMMPAGGMMTASGPQGRLLIMGISGETFWLKLVASDFRETKTLDEFIMEMPRTTKLRATPPVFAWSSSRDNIYVGKEDRGYEIHVFDADGQLIRQIRKDYKKVPVSESYKEKILKMFPPGMREMAVFPDFQPPFQSLMAADNGMLFVCTFEEGHNPGEFMFDIFDKDGVFIGRTSLNVFIWEGHLWARLKDNKFYYLKEKDSGYKELLIGEIR